MSIEMILEMKPQNKTWTFFGHFSGTANLFTFLVLLCDMLGNRQHKKLLEVDHN